MAATRTRRGVLDSDTLIKELPDGGGGRATSGSPPGSGGDEHGDGAQGQARGSGDGTSPGGWLLALVGPLKIVTKERPIVTIASVINYAQVDLINDVERQIARRGYVRIVVLKARQIGMSTIIEAILFILSVMLDNFSTLIVSHETKSAQTILRMTKRYWKSYPFAKHHVPKYISRAQLSWEDNESNIEIATAKNVDAGRSPTINGLHASEVAFWPDPDGLMGGLRQAVPSIGLTLIFLESTANGVGNYFHGMCMSAMKGENEYSFRFYPWHKHPEYRAQFIDADQVAKYVELPNITAEERQLRKLGIGDDRLIWRRYAIENLCNKDVDKFHQEYPTTVHEAFISTGRNVIPLANLLAHYDPKNGRRGRLVRRGNKIELLDDVDGYFTVYRYPSRDRSWGVYLAGGDPTHTTTGDFACIQVINRRTKEQVAVYRRKLDPINFGKDMQLIGAWYNNAELAPEREGPGYASVGCIVADNYPNVYQTQDVAKAPGHPSIGVQHGWSTNAATKHLAISHLIKAFADPLVRVGNEVYGLLIHDPVTLIELRDYVTTETGLGYTNSDGSEYDDGVMALAIAVTVDNIEPPPAAYTPRPPHELPEAIRQAREHSIAAIGSGAGGPVDIRPIGEETPVEPDEIDIVPAWEMWRESTVIDE